MSDGERDDDVERPLQVERRARHPERRQVDEREPFDAVDADVRRHDLEQARDDVDLHVELTQRANEVQELLLRLVRERDQHTLDGVGLDELGELRLASRA